MSKLEAQWIVGFVDGEGCFYVGVTKNSSLTSGFQIQPEFTVVQHERDIQVLYDLKEHFKCGIVSQNHRFEGRDLVWYFSAEGIPTQIEAFDFGDCLRIWA